MIDGKQLGTIGFEKIGTSYEDMDCQKFIEWCLKQCGLDKDLAGSNAWFREVWNNGVIMTPEECVARLGTVPAGAFLFILEDDGGEPERYKADGLGNASHIGIVTGGSDIHNVAFLPDAPGKLSVGGMIFNTPLADVFDYARRIKAGQCNLIR